MFALGLEQIDGRWHLLVQNSWGTRWGAGGYCYLPESYLRDWHEAWRLQAATDDPRGESPPAAKE
jgi:C1A family cysteine protease